MTEMYDEPFHVPDPDILIVERSGLGKKFIQDVDVLHFACSNANKRGNIAVQIQ